MEVLAGPLIESRPALNYLAIGTVTQFRGMIGVRDRLWAELYVWLAKRGIDASGSAFMRLNVIDMKGPMDIEAGVLMPEALPGDKRVRSGVFQAGEYAALTIRNHKLEAHRIIGDWMKQQGREYDRWPVPDGDRFASRYELNLTDPRAEPRRKNWVVQLNFLVRPPEALSA